jgi:hypothetical protein
MHATVNVVSWRFGVSTDIERIASHVLGFFWLQCNAAGSIFGDVLF